MDAFEWSDEVMDLAMDPVANPFAPAPGGPGGKFGSDARLPAEPTGAITQWDPWHNPVGGDPGDQDGPGTPFGEEDEAVEPGDEIVPGLELAFINGDTYAVDPQVPGWFDTDGDNVRDSGEPRTDDSGPLKRLYFNDGDGSIMDFLRSFKPWPIA